MGYSITFEGSFKLNKTLVFGHHHIIKEFNETYHGRPRDSKTGEVLPSEYPSCWCQWTPNEEGTEIEWDGKEKFYCYIEWIKYLIDKFLAPWGYTITGIVTWFGEDNDDTGIIDINNNEIKVFKGRIVYDVPYKVE